MSRSCTRRISPSGLTYGWLSRWILRTLQITTQRARFFGNVARTTDYSVGWRTISLRRAASFVDSLLRSSSATSTSPPSSSSSSVGRASTTYVYGQPRRSTPRNCYRCARNGSINAERRWSGVETDGECPTKEEQRRERWEREGAWKGALRVVEGAGESVGVRREGETEKGVGDEEGAKGTEERETDGGWGRVVDVIERGEKEG